MTSGLCSCGVGWVFFFFFFHFLPSFCAPLFWFLPLVYVLRHHIDGAFLVGFSIDDLGIWAGMDKLAV